MQPGRFRKAPGLGPRILFFSGGSALNGVSRMLKGCTHNSVHLVTTFDSGGSSAILRKAFNMPSPGDLRSRLIALADENITGHPEVCRLLTCRLPTNLENRRLLARLETDRLLMSELGTLQTSEHLKNFTTLERLAARLTTG